MASLYYLLTTLPQLPELGGGAPLPFSELQRLVRNDGHAGAIGVVDVLAMEPLIQSAVERRIMDGTLPETGEEWPAAVVEALAADPVTDGEEVWLDRVWAAFFGWALQMGKKCHAPLLAKWAVFEPSLRDHLAASRNGHKQAPGPFDTLMDIVGCNNPLDAEQMLDAIRWRFLDKETPRFTFHIDELVAYALKHRLLERYTRLDRAKGTRILEEVTTL